MLKNNDSIYENNSINNFHFIMSFMLFQRFFTSGNTDRKDEGFILNSGLYAGTN